MRARGERLGDVARVANAAVRDQGDAAVSRALGSLVNRGDLRHADAGNDPAGADRPRPDAYLDGVGPRVHQGFRALGRGHVAGDHVDLVAALEPAHRVDDIARMAVRRIDHQDIHACPNERRGAVVVIHAHRRAHAQSPPLIFASLGKAGELINVLDGDQASQFIVFVHQQ